MRVLVFDTETTGLPVNRSISAKNKHGNWPHIVSISWMVLENDIPVHTRSFIVKPMNWVVPPESTAIHGISHEKAVREGIDLNIVMDMFIADRYDVLIAHNLEFDENVVVNAIYWDLGRLNFAEFPHPKRCTMRAGRDLCRLPSTYGYRFPKLSDLYNYAFGVSPIFENLHSSLYDVEILVRILLKSQELRERLGLNRTRVEDNNVATPKSKTLSL